MASVEEILSSRGSGVQPPRRRPSNEAAGYLGYYTRKYLRVVFDLVDRDGSVPTEWFYWKAETREARFFEEKPSYQDQGLHPSQERTLRLSAQLYRFGAKEGVVASTSAPYVIWEADRLVIPEFPIRLTRIGVHRGKDFVLEFDRAGFDRWMTEGLETPSDT